ncbi:hypothetical protein [Ruegeria arenilitoris]|uniref:hypothetical protein n=1 Tax=Ruegeria arenilitoris TaxID=1173585 RepID=UPI0020C3E0FE|nr:hypothetical protein [Ruegeria arenilitoris]
MGGALEIALACDYRVATPDALMRLLPGAGGIQRLPRIAGLEAATQMIQTLSTNLNMPICRC